MLQKIFFSFQRLSFSKQVLVLSVIAFIVSLVLGISFFKRMYIFFLKPDFISANFFVYFPKLEGNLGGFLSAFLFFFPFLVFLFLPKKQTSVFLKGTIIPFSLFLINGWQYILFAVSLIVGGIVLGKFLRILK